MKSWLEQNGIEMYSTHNKGKPVAAGRFIRIFKNKVYKYMASVSKNAYIDKTDDILINGILHIITQLKWNLLM